MKRLIFILLSTLSITCQLWSQETIVVGEVYDANTGEAISNVNIHLQGTQIGVTTNTEGLFLLRTQLEQTKTMVVSAVGYHTEKFKIEPHTQAGIEIALREKVGNLGEVFVTPGENPALPLMEKVRARRQFNTNLNTTQPVATTAMYVSDIAGKNLQRAIWKNLRAGIIQHDSTYLLPLYWKQQTPDTI